MAITIKDIAKALGVSHSTVSRALHNSPEIGIEMKRKIRDLAESMNYRPNAMARNLVRQRSDCIGIIIPDIENPFYASLCKNLVRFFENNDYKLIICNSNREPQKENSYIRFLLEQQTDGIILIPADVEQKHFIELTQSRIPLVLIDHDGGSFNTDSIMCDNYTGAKMAVLHLLKLGYHEIVHISGPDHAEPSLARIRGYSDALKEHNIHNFEDLIIRSDSTFMGGIEAAVTLTNRKSLPDAVFTVNDITAIALLQHFNEKKIRVPEDIALVGFDDISMARMVPVPLTTVRQTPSEFAREAGDLLLDRIKSKYQGKCRNVLLKPTLVIRDSCGVKLRPRISPKAAPASR